MNRLIAVATILGIGVVVPRAVAAPEVVGAVSAVSAPALQDVVFAALADEMDRSLSELRLGDEAGPYFLSYRVDDLEVVEVGSAFGSPLRSRRSFDRVMSVEVRVGTPELDNTNFFSFAGGGGLNRAWNGSARIARDDSYAEIRRQAWLLTDGAYKKALEELARKAAALESRRVPGDIGDFAPVTPTSIEDVHPRGAIDIAAAELLTADVSRVFRKHPAIHHSVVRLRYVRQDSRYLNSEGSRFRRAAPILELVVAASTQAGDGAPFSDATSWYARGLDGLPGRDVLEREASDLAERLARARQGDEVERYNGPVLFTGQAAAELVHQVLAPQLSGWRPPVAEDQRLEQRLAQMGSSLNDRIGGRVLARSMRLVDDAAAQEIDGAPLFGGYAVDDDGVPASTTVLVERGILKGLVSGRSPSRGVDRSTGNRRGSGALVSNLLLDTSDGKSEAELKGELQQLVDERDLEFGIIVRRLGNPLLMTGVVPGDSGRSLPEDGVVGGVVEAIKVFRDGREETMGSLRFAGLSAASFRDIVAASARRTVYSAPLRSAQSGVSFLAAGSLGSALAGPAVVSVAVPDLLFEELTVTAPVGPVPRAPLTSHPFFAD